MDIDWEKGLVGHPSFFNGHIREPIVSSKNEVLVRTRNRRRWQVRFKLQEVEQLEDVAQP